MYQKSKNVVRNKPISPVSWGLDLRVEANQ